MELFDIRELLAETRDDSMDSIRDMRFVISARGSFIAASVDETM